MRVAVALAAIVLSTGCLTVEGDDPCQADATVVAAFDDRHPRDDDEQDGWHSDARQPWATVARLEGDLRLDVVFGAGKGTAERLGDGPARLYALRTLAPPASFTHTIASDDGPCQGQLDFDVTLRAPIDGALAQAGRGAIVHTAGFWENGTLFYTNIASVDGDEWPRAGWYAWGGAEPLQVYVYEEDPSEIPPHWGRADAQAPLRSPARPPTEYLPTIAGFNEALKGLSTTTTTVVRIAPEDAYTREGLEEHPLHGDALVFLIRLEAVANAPCPWVGPLALPPCFEAAAP